jgi:hypothetical protein
MVRKNRDSKFIIYEVLYIFVITVLVLKGADLDLDKVISSNRAVSKSVRDSLVTMIDSLTAKGLKFEIKLNPDIQKQNVELKEKVESLNKKVATLSDKIKELPPPELAANKEIKPKEQTIMQSPISITQTFYQYTWNIARNSGDVPTNIYDPKNMSEPIVTIPAGQEKKFNLMGQSEVIAKYGTQEEKINVIPLKPPQIKITKVTTKMDGSTIYAQDLQNITVFNVTIVYLRPEQLKITHSGPISVSGPYKDNNGNNVYYVSLKIAPNETKYDEWINRPGTLQEADGRYKANFFFFVTDKISKAHAEAGDSFYFTDFSK